MGCSSEAKRGEAVCECSGSTVFEGAVIGQVFTGDVQMQCPRAEQIAEQTADRAPTETGRPLSTALIALAIWQATYPMPGLEATCGSTLPHAALFLVAGAVTRYAKPKVIRWAKQRWAARCARPVPPNARDVDRVE